MNLKIFRENWKHIKKEYNQKKNYWTIEKCEDGNPLYKIEKLLTVSN